jgi:RhtB (resistance to homoserine/threonine) family protein
MTPFLTQFAIVIVAHLLAVMSPGPDFIVVSRNSITYSRKIGIYTALGVALGISVHVFYSLAGIALVISKSILVFNLIKILGAAYLIFIGYKMLRSKRLEESSTTLMKEEKEKVALTAWRALKNGFLVNVLNPKATLFFLALFTQVIVPETPQYVKLIYGAEMMLMTFIWFTLVSVMFSHRIFKEKIFRVRHIIDRITGAVLVALGLKVLFSSK